MERNGSCYYAMRNKVNDVFKRNCESTYRQLSLETSENVKKCRIQRRKVYLNGSNNSYSESLKTERRVVIKKQMQKRKPLRLIKNTICNINLTNNDSNNNLCKTPLSKLTQYQKNRAVIKTNKIQFNNTNISLKQSSPYISKNSPLHSISYTNKHSFHSLSNHPHTISSYMHISPHHSLSPSKSVLHSTHSKMVKDIINMKCKSGVSKGKKLEREINRNSIRYFKLQKKKKTNEYYMKKERDEFKRMCIQSAKHSFKITTFHNVNNDYSYRSFNDKLDYLSKISERMAYVDRKRYFEDVINFKPDPEFYFNEECKSVQREIEKNRLQKKCYHKFILDKQIFQAIRMFYLNKKAKEKILKK